MAEENEDVEDEMLRMMEEDKINALIVTDTDNHPIGALNMHDLLRAGVI